MPRENRIEGLIFKTRPDGKLQGTIHVPVTAATLRTSANGRRFIDFIVEPFEKANDKGVTHRPVIIDSADRYEPNATSNAKDTNTIQEGS